MATTTAFPSLTLPEDTMDMSSPANQAHDGDIDLDFTDGDYDGGVELREDEQMLTDGEQTRPATATDTMMDDDMQAQVLDVQEEVMQDTPDIDQSLTVQQDDDELIDYGEDDIDFGQQIEDTTLVNADDDFNTFQDFDTNVEHVDEEVARQPEDVAVEQPTDLATLDFAEYTDEAAAHDFTGDAPVHDSGVDANAPLSQPLADQADATLIENEHDGYDETVQELSRDYTTANANEPSHSVPILETGVQAEQDGPGTPTDTGLHPMTVYYGEHALPLFKSKKQPDGLLKDDNLASLSLHDLIRNCRERLALKIGNIPEDQELTLAFDHMGLMLVENARAAFEHSLNDVLEVYLHLHQNDGTFDIPPLSLTLTHQQFSNQLAVLKQAAETGQGMSAFVPASEEEQQEYYGEGEELGANGEGVAEHEQHYEGQQHAEQNGEASNVAQEAGEAHSELHANHDYSQEEDYQGQEYQNGVDYDEEQGHDEAGNHNHAQEVQQAPDDDYTGDEELAAELAQAGDYDAGDADAEAGTTFATEALDESVEQSATLEPPAASEEKIDGDGQEAASTTSSHTVQGDDATGSTGEYKDEDLIHWDEEDSDLTKYSEPAADGQDDLIALPDLLAEGGKNAHLEPEAEATDAAAQHTAHGEAQDAGDDVAGFDDGAQPSADQALHLGSEDFLNDEAYQFDTTTNGEQHNEGTGEDFAQDLNYDDQADTFDHQQQDEFLLPGDDDGEQYDTAQDFLQGGDYEHGLEHQPDGDGSTGEDGLNADAGDNGYQPLGEQAINDEDEIDFDDDTTEQHEARKASAAGIAAATTNSLHAKRSFEELAEDDFELLDEPEMKKVRSG